MPTLLPNARQQFTDLDGAPYAGGRVYFYVPGTTTYKDTYLDAGGKALNTNPVILDSAGTAVIYGTGSYRQVLKDKDDNLVWDQLTADTSSAGSSWAGTATGTANNIVLAAPNFSSLDGQAIDFIAALSNVGALQVTVNGTAVPAKLDTLSGPVQTPAGCVVAGDRYRVTYDATAGLFHLTPLVDRAYVDAGDAAGQSAAAAAQAAAQSYAQAQAASALAQANQSAAAADGVILAQANQSAAAADGVILGQAQTYAQNQAASALSQANQYAGNVAVSQAASALAQANQYTNGQISSLQSNVNGQISTLAANDAATYSQGVRLSGAYTAASAGRQPGSVVTVAGGSTSVYSYLQYNVNGQWRTATDA